MSFFEDGSVANFPPRRKSQASLTSWADKSTLEILQLMGFPKERAEKAIAATGSNGVQDASDWLLSHVNDPNLDLIVPREYIIYLCPKGQLLDQLQQFWGESLRLCGWNSAHIYHPHITLCSFFPMCDSKVDILDPLMELLLIELNQWPRVGSVKLDLYTKNKNFIGYFVKSPHDRYVESLMVRLQQEFLKAGVDMKPQLKQLHLTLAFQYLAEHHGTLMRMAEKIDLNCPAHWEIQVFSRDQAIKLAELGFLLLFRFLCHFSVGFRLRYATLPNFSPAQREETVQKQNGVQNNKASSLVEQMEVEAPELVVSLPEKTHSNITEYDNVWEGLNNVDRLYATVNKPSTLSLQQQVQRPPRKLLISRHGERCDFAFYRDWFEKSFDEEGHYRRINLNCPKFLVARASFKDFSKDAPLTLIGRQQARLTGEALLDAGQAVTNVYCSPSLRCVETATEILKGMRSPCRLRVEPCLYEWSGWCKPKMPQFMSPMELEANGFPVDSQYTPYLTAAEISMSESVVDYYNRSYNFTKTIMRRHKEEGGTFLFVGHSGTLDACTRQMLGHQPRDMTSFRDSIRGCPYCAMCCMEEDSGMEGAVGGGWRIKDRSAENGCWRLVDPPVLPLSHGANKDVTWRTLLS
ncbi:ubiquitin-associated and SH3 domain-containing protein B [Elysia marginata]|uniref:Ubiquitin-associated and SH3 domain-containing protein B n=1 Tax=Elysia marginata TaxID=1093978 RepID=A0AAV4FNR2_9GAST|nr:ubiquitin-associated and SH3 domain-containing protein B [Elysia marginata]